MGSKDGVSLTNRQDPMFCFTHRVAKQANQLAITVSWCENYTTGVILVRRVEFHKWVKAVGGIISAAKILKENPRTVRAWVHSERPPAFSSAVNIVIRSKNAVDFNGIYQPIARKKFIQSFKEQSVHRQSI